MYPLDAAVYIEVTLFPEKYFSSENLLTNQTNLRLTDKMKDDERHIIQRILRGETALYEHFLNTYGQQVFILVARIVSNQEDAEELTKMSS